MEWRTKTYRLRVGAFLVVTFLLLLAVVVAVSFGKFFRTGDEFQMTFDESVEGLRAGDAVLYMGIEVGEVVEVGLVQLPERPDSRTVLAAPPPRLGSGPHPRVRLKIWDRNRDMIGPDTVGALELSGILSGERVVALRPGLEGDRLLGRTIIPAEGPGEIATFPSVSKQVRDGFRILTQRDQGVFKNLEAFFGSATGLMDELRPVLVKGPQALDDISAASQRFSELVGRLDVVVAQIQGAETASGLVDKVYGSLDDFDEAIGAVEATATDLGGEDGAFAKLEQAVVRFDQVSGEFELLARSSRRELLQLLTTLEGTNLQLSRVLAQLGRNPLLGGR